VGKQLALLHASTPAKAKSMRNSAATKALAKQQAAPRELANAHQPCDCSRAKQQARKHMNTWKLHAVTAFASQQLVKVVMVAPLAPASATGAKKGKGKLLGHTAVALCAMHLSIYTAGGVPASLRAATGYDGGQGENGLRHSTTTPFWFSASTVLPGAAGSGHEAIVVPFVLHSISTPVPVALVGNAKEAGHAVAPP
jgi:hypothetical protein